MRMRLEDLFANCLFQLVFDLTRTLTKNNNTNCFCKQTSKYVEEFYRHIAGFDMTYEDIRVLFREAWKQEVYNLFQVDTYQKENEGKNSIPNESRPEKFNEIVLETNLSWIYEDFIFNYPWRGTSLTSES